MSNLEKWQYWMKDIGSPKLFIEWGFYSLFSAALQRRVFVGDPHNPIYGNQIIILCAPPAVGKSMVIREVRDVFQHDLMKINSDLEKNQQKINEMAGVAGGESRAQMIDRLKNQLVPIGPDASTYEALVSIMAKSSRFFWIKDANGINRGIPNSSVLFMLSEVGSLFRQDKNTKDTITFINQAYDCEKLYEKDTKTGALEQIRNPCLSMLAGTTPESLKRIFASEILNEGFSSRAIFVVAFSNRFDLWNLPTWTEDQHKARLDIIKHLAKVAKLQGQVKETKEAVDFCTHWWEVEHALKRPNNHPKLAHYYGRKKITVRKTAMAIHFSDSLEMEMGVEPFKLAIALHEETEKKMHLALKSEDKNPLAETTDTIYKYILRNGNISKRELKVIFFSDLQKPDEDLEVIIKFLMETNKIRASDIPGVLEAVPPNGEEEEKFGI